MSAEMYQSSSILARHDYIYLNSLFRRHCHDYCRIYLSCLPGVMRAALSARSFLSSTIPRRHVLSSLRSSVSTTSLNPHHNLSNSVHLHPRSPLFFFLPLMPSHHHHSMDDSIVVSRSAVQRHGQPEKRQNEVILGRRSECSMRRHKATGQGSLVILYGNTCHYFSIPNMNIANVSQ